MDIDQSNESNDSNSINMTENSMPGSSADWRIQQIDDSNTQFKEANTLERCIFY